MNAKATIDAYYEALRNGNSLTSYFADDESILKFGVTEAAFGADDVSEALQEQTETTAEWTVESHALSVTECGSDVDSPLEAENVAWFGDLVTLAWTDTTTGIRRRFETRWSGTLIGTDDGWQFVTMHVSAPRES